VLLGVAAGVVPAFHPLHEPRPPVSTARRRDSHSDAWRPGQGLLRPEGRGLRPDSGQASGGGQARRPRVS